MVVSRERPAGEVARFHGPVAGPGRRLALGVLGVLAAVVSVLLWPTATWASGTSRSSQGSVPQAVRLSSVGQVPVAGVSPDEVWEASSVSPLVLLSSRGLVGIDLATGKQAWATRVPFPAGGEKDAVVTGGQVFTWPAVTSTAGPLEALNAATGAVEWTKPGFMVPRGSQGAVTVGRMLVTIASQPRSVGLGRLEGLDKATGTRRWTLDQIHGQAPDFPITSDGARVFDATRSPAGTGWRLASLNPATGRVGWQTATYRGSAEALTAGGGTVAVVTGGLSATAQLLANQLYVFDARSGRKLWSTTLPGSWDFTAPPRIEGGNVIVETEQGLTPRSGITAISAYRLRTGRDNWGVPLESASYVTGAGSLLFAELNDSGTLVAADAASGNKLGSATLPFAAAGPIYASGNRLAIVGFDQNVYVFSVER